MSTARGSGTLADLVATQTGTRVLECSPPWGRPVATWEPLFGEDSGDEVGRLRAELVDRHGEARESRMAGTTRNMPIYPNLVINDVMAISVRTVSNVRLRPVEGEDLPVVAEFTEWRFHGERSTTYVGRYAYRLRVVEVGCGSRASGRRWSWARCATSPTWSSSCEHAVGRNASPSSAGERRGSASPSRAGFSSTAPASWSSRARTTS